MICSQLLLTIVLLTAHTVLSDSFPDIVMACYKENGYNGHPLNFNDPAIPNNIKCAIACIFEKLNAFKEDGSVEKGSYKEYILKTIPNENLRNKFIKAVDDCDAKAHGNKCETAYEFTKCINAEGGTA